MAEKQTSSPDGSSAPQSDKIWKDDTAFTVLVTALLTIVGFSVTKPALSSTVLALLITVGVALTSVGIVFLTVPGRLQDPLERKHRGGLCVASGMISLVLTVIPWRLMILEKLSPKLAIPSILPQVANEQALSIAPGNLVYVTPGMVNGRYLADLKQRLHDDGFEVANEAKGSAITLKVSAETSVKLGVSVGSNQIWQAVTAAQLTASDARHPDRIFSYQGHGTALESDNAAANSIDDAIRHLVTEFSKVVKKNRS